jgi:TRAP-type mannitol/chloroaromatic compound transport system permease small subunit
VIERLLVRVEAVNAAVGRALALAIFVMIAVIMYEVVARYFFNAPTPWAQDVSRWLQVAYVFLGGAYALQRGYFVRVDILFTRLPPRGRALIDLTVSTALFACFAAVIVWKGVEFAHQSYRMGEISATGGWRGPVWPAKFMVPIGMVLLTLAWLTHIARQALVLLRRDAA